MAISVIIPVYNKIEIVGNYIKKNIEHSTLKHEWIVIDNASDQATKDELKLLQAGALQKGHSFHIETEAENTGVARAWNKGLSLASKEYICILNNDCLLMPNWDQELIKHTELNNLAISTPFVLEPWMFKNEYSLEDFLTGKHNWQVYLKKNYNRVRYGIFIGVVLFGSRKSFQKIGTFDENFWLSLDESDYLLRAMQLGLKTGTLGSIVAYHLGGITRSGMKTDGGTLNQQYFEKKWGWHFETVDTNFPNKQIRSFQKWLFKNFLLMSRVNLVFPVKKKA